MRAERLEGSRNSLCRRVNVLSRPVDRDAAETRPRRSPVGARPRGAAIPLAGRLARGSNARDWRLDALSCRSGALACATNEARCGHAGSNESTSGISALAIYSPSEARRA
jgi:hypothetical protein